MPQPTIPPPKRLPALTTTQTTRAAQIFETRSETLAGVDDRLRSRLVRLTLARLVVITILLAVVLVGSAGTPSTPLLATIVALYIGSISYAAWLRRGSDLKMLAWLQIVIDLSAYVAVAVVTGGPISPLGFFVALPALSAALVLGAAASRTTAVASTIAYGLITVAYLNRWPRALWPMTKVDLSRDELALQLIAHVVAIPVVAALGSALAERLKRAGGALARLEEQRADLAALHEDVLRSIPVGLLTVDADGRVDGANPQVEQLLGMGVPSLLGKRASEALPFIEPSAWSSDELANGEARASDARDARLLAWSVSKLRRANDSVRGQLVVLEDRTQSAALRAQVERAEKLAMLGRLAAGLAHEIRNPLGAISGCVELVREGASMSEENRALLGTVLRESQRLNRLVGDMLAFARPRAAELKPLDLRSLLGEFVEIAAHEPSRATATLDKARCAASITAMADRQLLLQVLWNLFRNASQVSPEGGTVELWAAMDDGSPAIFVADRGPGIGRESRERIFESFYSEGNARGTGLGLAVVRQIIEGHHGTVEPRERDGGGTLFVVKLLAPNDQPA
jgi:two-component system sensor histidine kinase PilS (NtrC family)